MPMEPPYRAVFEAGDYIYGYANVVTEFTEAHGNEGATVASKIQVLTTDLGEAMNKRGPVVEKETFINSLLKHPKYSRIVSDSDNDKRAPALAGLRPGNVKNNREWRIKSKGSLYWATMDVQKHIHFILDGIDMDEVINKTHITGHPHGQDTIAGTDADAKTRTITHAELRWIYRNKVFPQVRKYVQFWMQNQCVEPPWRTNPGLWGLYVPKNSPSTPGIMWELD